MTYLSYRQQLKSLVNSKKNSNFAYMKNKENKIFRHFLHRINGKLPKDTMYKRLSQCIDQNEYKGYFRDDSRV